MIPASTLEPGTAKIPGLQTAADTKHLKALERVQTEIAALDAWLVNSADKTSIATDDITQRLTSLWLDALHLRNLVQSNSASISDAFYESRCLSWCCAHWQHREQLELSMLRHLYYEVVIMASRHKNRYLMPNVVLSELRDDIKWLSTRVGSFITQHMRYGSLTCWSQLQEQEEVDISEEVAELPLQLQEEHLRLQVELKYDSDNEEDVKKRKKKQEEAEVAKECSSSIDSGFMFVDTHQHRAETLLQLASRTFGQLEKENLLLNSLPRVRTPFQHTELQANRLQAWLVNELDVDPGEEFNEQLQQFASDLMLPCGARTTSLRSRRTRGHKPSAQSLLVRELGVEVVDEIGKQLTTASWPQIAKLGPVHPLYDTLLLCYFSYAFRNETLLPFLDAYFVLPSRLLMQLPEHLTRRFVPSGYRRLERTPRMCRLLEQWVVCDAGEWHYCQDATELLLCWMKLMRDRHHSKLDCEKNISDFLDSLHTAIDAASRQL